MTMDYDYAPETWMALPEACVSSDDIFVAVARGPITPPRLLALPTQPPAADQLAENAPAPLRFPAEQVGRWAEKYASYARGKGIPHSMRLWRECFHQALVTLAREALRQPRGAMCASLHWRLRNGEYLVAATFSAPTIRLH
ncbi:MAG TPA: hypothetical protein VJN88_10875 [Ktedonobacterales bacterium]|nr:hypothetical protein [Ktedonobacterales bacterium]